MRVNPIKYVAVHTPFPPAELARAYEDIKTGMANRMMEISEREQQIQLDLRRHQQIESEKVNIANVNQRARQITLLECSRCLRLSLSIFLLFIACYALHQNMPTVAGISIVASILVIYVLKKFEITLP